MTTKSGIRPGVRWLKEGSFQVVLANGRNVELGSREGADDFIDTVGTDFISTNLTATDDHELTYAYMMMETVSEHASPEKIATGFPESELRSFVDLTRDTLKTLSTDLNWLRSGTVSVCHDILLQAVASFSKHPSFLKIFIYNEGMEAVAKFYASRKKNDTPSHYVSRSILLLVRNAVFPITQEGDANLEKAFGTIEKTGLLGQFIRCIPVYPEKSATIVTCLQSCLQLVKKKLKSGTRTGDILDAVIAGKDGPINETAKSALTRLQRLARLSNSNDNKGNKYADLKVCNHCLKSETLDGAKVMKCQRCKVAYYCNKVCQVANWKSHKKVCKAMSNSNVSPSAQRTSETTMWAFIKSNYFDIVKEVYKKTQEYNVPKKELFVEMDFYGDAPALRNEFKVWLTSDFLEESAIVDAPEWFRTMADKKGLARHLREECERVASDDLLAVYRAGNAMLAIQTLRCPLDHAGKQLLSDEAVESIGREDYYRMVAYLGQSITNKYFEKRSGLI
jgi:hypothetical protein